MQHDKDLRKLYVERGVYDNAASSGGGSIKFNSVPARLSVHIDDSTAYQIPRPNIHVGNDDRAWVTVRCHSTKCCDLE